MNKKTEKIHAHGPLSHKAPIPGVKNIIAVASGKGGVGKSTTAVNLALALSKQGAQVGLCDADIYGPNQPHMLGIHTKPSVDEDKYFYPIVQYGIQTISMGYLIDPDTPMIWRGPMVSAALQQLLTQTRWQSVDYLIVDLPPGTGDVQLTLAQKIPVSGAIIVTTPQPMAVLDAQKGLAMFKKVNVPVLGLVENMSGYTCAHCGEAAAPFGQTEGDELANRMGTKLLGTVPLIEAIGQQADRGRPIVLAQPDSKAAQCYYSIADRMVAELCLLPRNYANRFGTIAVEN